MIKLVLKHKKTIKEEDKEADRLALKRLDSKELEKDPRLKKLISLGYIPIIFAKNQYLYQNSEKEHTSIIGKGVYGTAYDVTKDGKRLIAKFTEEDNELAVRKAIEKIRNQLPEEISKHVVKVYNIIQGLDSKQIDRTKNQSYVETEHIIIMEPLIPMNKYEHEILYNGTKGIMTKNKIDSNIKNIPLLLSAIEQQMEEHDILGPALKNIEGLREELHFALLYAVKPIIDNFDFKNTKDYYEIASTISKDITREIAKRFIKDIAKFDPNDEHNLAYNKNFYSYIRYSINDGIHDLLSNIGSKTKFATHSHEDEDDDSGKVSDDAPEQQASFVRAMHYIRDNHGIEWGDLHGDNVMIRPSTRDYVASDVGNFILKTTKSAKKDNSDGNSDNNSDLNTKPSEFANARYSYSDWHQGDRDND